MKRVRKSLEEATRYGFRWEQLDVVRMAEFGEMRVVGIETEFDTIQVYVSPKGRSIRVWKGDRELK